MSSPTTVNEPRFRALLEHWNQHQKLRSNGASVSDLAASRSKLDAARRAIYI